VLERLPTPIHALRGLAVFAESPSDEHTDIAHALGLTAVPTPAEYSDLFLFQLYPYASVYLGPEGMMGGLARERIAGFWNAVGLTPPPEPDHLAALLGLYASLAERALETDPDQAAESALAGQAARALLEEHLAPWVFGWLDRMEELASGTYAAWAVLLRDLLSGELPRSPVADSGEVGAGARTKARPGDEPGALLQHLRDAPTLPDPRGDGTADFIAGLLAPVRCGMVVTRADLAGMARALDLGLRAGERRYALEHLLAQDAERTLKAFAIEARRQGDAHGQRVSWLGESAMYMMRRAELTAALCDELSTDGLS
jgi:TorA maturation chaperone TorD